MNVEHSPSKAPVQLPRNTASTTLIWVVVASVLGLLCFLLPSFFIPDAQLKREYGQYAKTLIRWFMSAYVNGRFWPSACSFAAVGLFLGWVRPRSWSLLCWSTVALCALLHSINVVYDISQDRTSHNLLPFEFIPFVFFGLVAVVGGFVSSRLKRLRNSEVA